jgi:hypothetical protein
VLSFADAHVNIRPVRYGSILRFFVVKRRWRSDCEKQVLRFPPAVEDSATAFEKRLTFVAFQTNNG